MSVTAGSSRSPAEEALDAMEQVDIYLSWVPPGHAQAARDAATTVRERLERLTEERDALAEQGRIAAARYGENFTRRMAAEAEVARLTAELQRNSVTGTTDFRTEDVLALVEIAKAARVVSRTWKGPRTQIASAIALLDEDLARLDSGAAE